MTGWSQREDFLLELPYGFYYIIILLNNYTFTFMMLAEYTSEKYSANISHFLKVKTIRCRALGLIMVRLLVIIDY